MTQDETRKRAYQDCIDLCKEIARASWHIDPKTALFIAKLIEDQFHYATTGRKIAQTRKVLYENHLTDIWKATKGKVTYHPLDFRAITGDNGKGTLSIV